jgi:hypothetical protein
MRWLQVQPVGKAGPRVERSVGGSDNVAHPNPDDERPGRHVAVLAICWDDWEQPEFQRRLAEQMARP